MSAIRRIVSAAMAVLAAVALIVETGPAPSASAATCNSPEANVDPPTAVPVTPNPGPVQRPTGRRPRGTNPSAPLPKLGPLIRSLLHPSGSGYAARRDPPDPAAPIQQQAAVVPAPPVPPPGGGAPAPPAVPQPAPNPAAAPAAAAPDPGAAIGGSTTSLVEWVTGPNSPNRTLERFGISGTDLGIPWDNGDPANRQVLMAFGDTFGYCRLPGQQWRYNTLFRSQDRDLSDGILVGPGIVGNKYSGSPVLQSNFSRPILPHVKWAPSQEGMIPTAAISVGGKQYMNFMSIKQWGRDGEWSTNYSAIAMSPDNGEHWGIFPQTVRSTAPENVPGARYVPGNENFQMGAYLRGGDGYLYSFGTPSGRGGSAYLSRVPEGQLIDVTRYQYWNDSGGWVPSNPGAATPVIPGPVGEMSAQYNSYLKKFLVLYSNGANDVVARTAPAPQGPWSAEQPLVSSMQMPGGIYAPYLHPWTSGKDVFFTLSLWNAYDVMLMHTVLG
ncbi:DUF4185 domain-containing protein [Mycobacterium talmoniae]|uniref:DUF4185 domain-containing protein n=1 Tax=Mycobacterium talmoniae TaxID=1858794 RepID=A0A1S1N723_9MYCO|nr:hypothetical protein BKN37_22290 [Mycobacterium talmoniae]